MKSENKCFSGTRRVLPRSSDFSLLDTEGLDLGDIEGEVLLGLVRGDWVFFFFDEVLLLVPLLPI